MYVGFISLKQDELEIAVLLKQGLKQAQITFFFL